MRKKYGINAEEIMSQIGLDSEITIEEIEKKIDKSESTVEKTIKKLRDAGVIKRVGSRKTGRWKIQIKLSD
jgi:ATP-dependent DNA helicase RecG